MAIKVLMQWLQAYSPCIIFISEGKMLPRSAFEFVFIVFLCW